MGAEEREALSALCDNEAIGGPGMPGYCYAHNASVEWSGHANASDVCCSTVERVVAPLLDARGEDR